MSLSFVIGIIFVIITFSSIFIIFQILYRVLKSWLESYGGWAIFRFFIFASALDQDQDLKAQTFTFVNCFGRTWPTRFLFFKVFVSTTLPSSLISKTYWKYVLQFQWDTSNCRVLPFFLGNFVSFQVCTIFSLQIFSHLSTKICYYFCI